MKVYLDLVFLENLILNTAIIYQISKFAKQKISFKINLFASLIGSVYVTLIRLFSTSFIAWTIIKLLIINIVIYVAFKPSKIVIYLKLIAYYFLIFYIYIGAIIGISTFFNINLNNTYLRIGIYILGYLVTYLLNQRMWKVWKSNIKGNDLVYKIMIKSMNKTSNNIEINAFVDTGNSLKDVINNLDIFIVQNTNKFNYHMAIKNEKVEVCLNTVNANCKLDGYIFNNILIFKNNKKIVNLNRAVIVFVDRNLSTSNKYNSLISYDTYIEKLQGVSL